MKHLKIKSKLLVGFAVVSILTLIVGSAGIFGIMSSDRRYSEMLKSNMAALSDLSDIREIFMYQRLILRAIMLDFENPSKLQGDIESLKSYENDMDIAMASYEKSITDENEEKSYFAAKNIYQNAYALTKQRFLDAVSHGDFSDTVAALTDGGQAADTLAEYLRETVDFKSGLVEKDSADLTKSSLRMTALQVGIMILAAVCAMILGLYISSLIAPPIKTLSAFFVRFGKTGDLSLSEEDQKNIAANSGNRDEIGRCIGAALNMVSRIININEKLGKVAEGDLTVEMEVLSEKDGMGLAVTKMLESLNKMFVEIRTASEQVSTGAGQVSQAAQSLASGSSEQAASIEEFSASLAELQSKTNTNAEKSAKARESNDKAGIRLEESIRSMNELLGAMKAIDESSSNINKVIKVIDDIAFQTNILALNAAVEAARAGQHGKGFAVVADEVRNLASKSATAAKETAALIEGSSERVKEGNKIVEKTNADLELAVENARESTRLIEEVSSESTRQALSITEINKEIDQISTVVQANSATAEQSAASAQEMSSQSVIMNGIVARFRLKQQNRERRVASGFMIAPDSPDSVTGQFNTDLSKTKY